MSQMIVFDLNDLGAPALSHAAPDRLVGGNPAYRTWEKDVVDGGRIRSGVWEATPGATRGVKGETWEFCHVLSGVVELTEDGGETRRLTAGDTFIMRPGFVGTWRTIQTVRTLWVIVSPA